MKIIKDVIANYLNDLCGLGKYTLDVGTGSANMALTLSEMGIRCITIEKSQSAFKEAKEIINRSKIERKPLLVKMDARKMSFLDDTFDCVIAYKSMHHIENAKSALDEMFRVCKQGGTIIIIEHKKNIRSALELFTTNRGEEHPNHIDIDEIYNNYVSDISLINGGTTEKKYKAYISPEFFVRSGKLDRVVILNQECVSETSFFRKVPDVESIKDLINRSQRNLYLSNEKQIYEQACNKLFEMPIYELYRHKNINFQVYMKGINSV